LGSTAFSVNQPKHIQTQALGLIAGWGKWHDKVDFWLNLKKIRKFPQGSKPWLKSVKPCFVWLQRFFEMLMAFFTLSSGVDRGMREVALAKFPEAIV
jgi:hypothetical protein